MAADRTIPELPPFPRASAGLCWSAVKPSVILAIVGVVIVASTAALLWPDDRNDLSPGGGETTLAPAPSLPPAKATDFSPIADSDRKPVELAPAPTAFLQVLDQETKAPVLGASVHRYQGGEILTFTDDQGRCGVPLKKNAQLVIAADGYLLRLCPTSIDESTAQAPKQVMLVPDRYTLRCRFRFLGAAGQSVDSVRVRFSPQAPIDRASARPPVPDAVQHGDALLQRAWTEHGLIANQAAFSEMRVQLGHLNSARVHTLRGDDLVRFCAPGMYQLEAATVDGMVGKAVFQAESVVDEPLVVRLQPGAFARGQVCDGVSGKPIAGAQVTVRGGDPLAGTAESDAAGHFRLGPLPGGAVTLELRRMDFASTVSPPIVVGGDEVRVVMQPLGAAALRGRVRLKPDLLPAVGATVSAVDALGGASTVSTGADGVFALRIGGKGDVRLSIAAPGYLAYGEVVAPDGGYQEYELWPADTATRLSGKLTGLLCGLVVDAQGHPVANMSVRLYPDQPSLPQVPAGRRAPDVGLLTLPLVTTTGSDGAFQLETQQFGPGALVPMDGKTQPDGGLRVEVVPGETARGLRVPAQERQ